MTAPAPAQARVALVLPSLAGGGAERMLLRLAGALAADGAEPPCRVDLVTATATGPLRDAVPDRVRLVDLAAGGVRHAVRPLADHLRATRPVALLSALTHMNVAALAARRLAGVPTRVVVSEHLVPSVAAPRSPHRVDRTIEPLLPLLYRPADAVVAVSEDIAADLARRRGFPRSRLWVIANPVIDAPVIGEAVTDEPAPGEAAGSGTVLDPRPADVDPGPCPHPWLDDEVPVVLGIGRLVPQKGFDDLLRAVAALRGRRPVRAVVLGDGPHRDDLAALAGHLGIADAVAFPGFVDDPAAWLSSAAVYVCSSRYEGMPTTLIEAAALGRPVVATDCPSGPRELLADRVDRLVPVGDAAALADAIERELDDPAPPLPDEVLRRHTVAVAADRYRALLLGAA